MPTVKKEDLSPKELAWEILLDGLGLVRGDECESCAGFGRRSYSSTATWRGGIGGQMFTTDVCDACWGSGNRHQPGLNLRHLRQTLERFPEAREHFRSLAKGGEQ